MHYITYICKFICAYMLLYICKYVYIGVFWLAFNLVLHHCSPRQGESPTMPRELQMQDQHWPDVTALSVSIIS